MLGPHGRAGLGGIQVQGGHHTGGGIRISRAGVDTQIGLHTLVDLTGHRVNRKPLQTLTGIVDDVAAAVGPEVTGTGVADCAVIAGHKETVTVDSQIKAVLGKTDVALIEQLRRVSQCHTAAGGITARTQHRGGVDVGEFSARAFEADGAGVGNVVTGDIQIGCCRPDTTQADIESHGFISSPTVCRTTLI